MCDRYATYDALARWQDERSKRLRLAFCWVHVRRDFLKPAAGGEAFEAWRQQWIKRFAELFHLNKERRQSHAPDRVLTAQSAAFNTAHCRLQQAVDRVFTIAAAELAAAPPDAVQAKPLRSLLNHRTGLTVFVDHPQVPMDNNPAERGLETRGHQAQDQRWVVQRRRRRVDGANTLTQPYSGVAPDPGAALAAGLPAALCRAGRPTAG